jgi:thymidylate synthase
MNKLDKAYTDLLQDILDNGVTKQDRTGTGTISVFARQIRHNMKDGFPLLTTKKMPFKTIVTELLWFLQGNTNIKWLVDNGCNIWNGDAYKNYQLLMIGNEPDKILSMTDFIDKIKNDEKFAKKWGDLGPIYGKQWRSWKTFFTQKEGIDQIQNLINDLKTNPDSRRLMVNAWNVGELDQMVLPPCHYGFQVYTRELTREERYNLMPSTTGHSEKNIEIRKKINNCNGNTPGVSYHEEWLDSFSIPKRAISLMWNQRSVDTFLGLPFNIASYGLLLEIIAKSVNMIPEELIGNLGDVHLYSNHIEQSKEQIGRELTFDEFWDSLTPKQKGSMEKPYEGETYNGIDSRIELTNIISEIHNIPKRTREPFPLPKLNINTEFWPTIGGECGIGPLDANAVFEGFKDDNFCRCLLEEDIQLYDYNSHPTIKAPLSN